MVFWYNFSPKSDDNPATIPSKGVYTYFWRYPRESKQETSENGTWQVGDQVFVKPQGARCTTKWPKSVVTNVGGMSGPLCVEVNGVPRHISDIRKVVVSEETVPNVELQNAKIATVPGGISDATEDGNEGRRRMQEMPSENPPATLPEINGRPQRPRNPPKWQDDYSCRK
jgi:hypothetical protein